MDEAELHLLQLIPNSICDDQNSDFDSEQAYAWTLRVDEHIDEESLEIMKLGMRSELTQAQRDESRSPSDLYHAIECHYHDSSVCLARFIYALKRLGHRRYGYRAIRQLSEFSIVEPPAFHPTTYLDTDELKIFRFLQNLVEVILVCLKGSQDTQDKLIRYFVEKHLHGTNPNNIKTLCHLFTLLLEREVISADRPQALVEALKEVGATHISEQCNLQSHYASTLSDVDTGSMNQSGITSLTDPGSLSLVFHRCRGMCSIKCSAFSSCLAVTILIIILALSFVSVTVSSRYITNVEHSTTLHHSNSTLILFNGRNYALKSLSVIQDSNHPGNFNHNITVYKHEIACRDLPHAVNIIQRNQSGNMGPTYALAGSNVTFKICGYTNQSEPTERLELALQYGLESLPGYHNYSPLYHDYLKFSYVIPGSNGEWKCKKVTFSLTRDGYYTTIFLTEPRSAVFNYSLRYFHRYFDISNVGQAETHSLYEDTESVTFVDNPHKYCYVATIHGRPGATAHFVHIGITYEYYTLRFFADNYNTMIAFPLIITTAIIGAEIIVIVLVKLRKLRCVART